VIGEPRIDADFVECVIARKFPNRFVLHVLTIADAAVVFLRRSLVRRRLVQVHGGEGLEDVGGDSARNVAVSQVEEVSHTEDAVDEQQKKIKPTMAP
jgi:hypothetical protein